MATTGVSSIVTGGATMTAATITPLVMWALSGFKMAMPTEVPFVVASLIFTGVHALVNMLGSRGVVPAPTTPPTGGQS